MSNADTQVQKYMTTDIQTIGDEQPMLIRLEIRPPSDRHHGHSSCGLAANRAPSSVNPPYPFELLVRRSLHDDENCLGLWASGRKNGDCLRWGWRDRRGICAGVCARGGAGLSGRPKPGSTRRSGGADFLWYGHTEGEAVRCVIRSEIEDARISRLRIYYFSPELLTDVAGELGVPVKTNGRGLD